MLTEAICSIWDAKQTAYKGTLTPGPSLNGKVNDKVNHKTEVVQIGN